MAEINNAIAEASQDLQTIEDFVNLPADSEVYPRLLPSVNVGTLAGAREAIFKAGGLPATPFATKDLMTASALVDGDYAMVTDDTVSENNGLYIKEGGAWVKSKLQLNKFNLEAIKTATRVLDYTDANLYDLSSVTSGYYISSAGEPTQSTYHTYSNKISVTPNKQITVSTRTGANIGSFVLFDYKDTAIGFVSSPSNPYTFTVPDDCDYIIVNSSNSVNRNGVIVEYGASRSEYKLNNIPTLINATISSDIEKSMFDKYVPNRFDLNHVYKSPNMFSPNDVTEGGYYTSQGSILESGTYSRTELYPAKDLTDYAVSWSTQFGSVAVLDLVCFNADKTFIVKNSAGPDGFRSFTTPQATAYIALNVRTNLYKKSDVMLFEGSEPIDYIKKGSVKISDVSIEGLNLPPEGTADLLYEFAENNIKTSANLFDAYSPNIRKGFAISPSQLAIVADGSKSVTDYIKVDDGETVTTSSADGYSAFGTVGFCDADKNIISFAYVSNNAEPNKTRTFTIPAGTKYIILDFTKLAHEGDRMLNRGSTALPFEFGGMQLQGVPIKQASLDGYDLSGRLVSFASNNARIGDEIHFTGDKHQAVLLDFPDSFTTNDPVHLPNGASITYQFMVDMWQGLVDEFPDYITKEKIGTDSSGALDVHSYTFMPTKVNRATYLAHEEPDYPRVLIYVQHIERLNQLYPFMAMREICRKWQTDPVLAALRYQVEFVVIPYGHPHGLGGGHYRFTSEGLNTNGDWPYLWNHVDDPLNGSAPFATQEARNMKAVMEEFRPHVFMDLHAHSYSEDIHGGMWIDADANPRYEDSVRTAILSLYPKVVERYPDAEPINRQLHVSYNNAPRQAPGYGYAMGCTGGLMEFIKNYKNRPPTDGIYNDNLILASSYLLNTIVQCIAEYRDYGRPNKGELYSGSGIYTPTYTRGNWV